MSRTNSNKKLNTKALRWIFKKSKSQTVNIIILAFLYASLAVLGVYSAIVSKYVVNAATGHDPIYLNNRIDGVVHYGLLLAIVVITQIIISIMQRIFVFRVSAKLEIAYKTELFGNIIHKEFSDISKFHSGELLNRLTSDISTITGAIVTIIPNLTYMIVKLIGIFVVMIQISVPFTMVFLVGGMFAVIVASLYRTKIKSFHKKTLETDGKVKSFLQEIIASLLMVKSFEAEQTVLKNATELQEANYAIKRKHNALSVISTSSFSLIFMLGYLFGMVWGAYNIVHGNITYGVLTEVVSLVSQIQGPISGLTGLFPTYFSATASAERIMEIENLPDENKLNSQIDVKKTYSRLKSINFDNITFSYDRDVLLDNTSLKINKGDFAAILGITGIGKSTLMKLLMSVFRVESGSIYFELDNGEKVYVDRNIRCMFAYVPQGNFLLSGTIRENVAFVCPNASDEEIYDVLHLACADDFISNLPDGLNTQLGERGIGLSEGQVQRLAIARALLTGSPILLLDECTSALDEKTEKQLLKNLKDLKNKTCIIITHKKAALTICNKEVQIADKKIKVKEI